MNQDLSALPFAELLKLATPGPFITHELGDEHFLKTNHWLSVDSKTQRLLVIEGLGSIPAANAELITRLLNHGPALVEALSLIANSDKFKGGTCVTELRGIARTALAAPEGGK